MSGSWNLEDHQYVVHDNSCCFGIEFIQNKMPLVCFLWNVFF